MQDRKREVLNAGRCIFCDKPIPENTGNFVVQVLYAGQNGHYIKKEPGKIARSHNVCGLPE